MNPLQRAGGGELILYHIALRISADARPPVGVSQGDDTGIRDLVAFNEADAFELWQHGKLCYRVVRQVCAAAQVDVPYPAAVCHQTLDAIVSDVTTVAQVQEVQVPAELRDRIDGSIRQVAALLKNQIPKARRHINDLLDSAVRDIERVADVKDAQVVKSPPGRQGEEGIIIQQLAVGQTKFTECVPLSEKRRDWGVGNKATLIEIDFEDVGTVLGKGKHRVVLNLDAIIEFELSSEVSKVRSGPKEQENRDSPS